MMVKRNTLKKLIFKMLLVGAVLVCFQAQPAMAVYFAQPGGYWQLEEADPLNDGVNTDVGTANGTCSDPNCPDTTTGRVGNAYDFVGAADTVSFADSAVFDLGAAAAADFSIELWVKMAAAPLAGNPDVLIGRFGTTTRWWIGVNDDGTVGTYFRDLDGGSPSQIDGTSNVADDAWHHIVVVRDGSTNDTFAIYVDGVRETFVDQSGDDYTDDSFDETAAVTLGQLNGDYFYGGLLDGVAIYDTAALSGDVIMQNYLNGLQGHDLDEEFAPAFSGAASDTIAVGFTAELTARAAGNPLPITYSGTNLPDGASVAGSTGVISWMPTDVQLGTNAFTINASNSQGTGTGQSWSVDVVDLCVSDLDGYWKLEEADPENDGTLDNVGTADGGCTAPNCPDTTTGRVGNAYDFLGTADTVTFADNAVFDFGADVATDFSIELWVKMAAAPLAGNPDVFIGRFSATTLWWVGVNDDGTVGTYFRDENGGSPSQIDGTSNVADDAWHHIAVVRDGTSDTFAIYVDGVRERFVDQSGDAFTDGSFDHTADVTLGQLNNNYYYGGLLDEIAIYASALSASTVAQHANAAAGQYYCNAAPTINSTAVTTATEDTAYAYTVTATDPESHSITFSLTTAPTGMTIDSATGAIAWTPDDGVTTEDVVVLATDQYGATDSQSFTITVTAVNDAPVITGQATLETAQDTALTITLADLTVTDPDNTYPTGFTLQVQSGTDYTVSGATITPDSGFTGDLTVPVTVNDGTDDSNVFNLTVTVTASGGGGGGGGGGSCFIGSLGL